MGGFTWEDLRRLHVVKQMRKMIFNWWQLDVLILNRENIERIQNPSLHLPPKDEEEAHILSFQNPLTKTLFNKEDFKASFFETLSWFQSQKSASDLNSFMETWPGTGLNLLISSIKADPKISDSSIHLGFVIGVGLLSKLDEENKKKITDLWIKAGLSHPFIEKSLPLVPVIGDSDKSHFIDIMELIAKEIMSVQKELSDKKKQALSMPRSANFSYGDMVGKSPAIQKMYYLLDKIKHSQNTILIQGENGTGKELIAKSIHQNSPRKSMPFIPQNCSALNDNLLESELFGHVKGSFTGAYKDKKGLFELAHNGTFFLDEIGDTSPAMQVKLLRVLQEGVFFPVGATEAKKVDVRIIAATNRNLKKMLEEGTFREDLYYRLNVINIHVPPLRERKEDIALLADYFINRYSPQPKIFTKRALNKLTRYTWPGNVRELQNEAERLAIFTSNDTFIKEEFLSEKIRNDESSDQFSQFLEASEAGMKSAIAKLERQMIAQTLKEENWNKTKAAKKLGISRAALVSKVKSYKIERKLFKQAKKSI